MARLQDYFQVNSHPFPPLLPASCLVSSLFHHFSVAILGDRLPSFLYIIVGLRETLG
ncbi:hypothetical protein NGA_0619400 [Nannochloropsis gaditana CCMP526]|uniref:uncharacterized protein n=1 Tax=Nannochloropsis gaditana (strain CCMP526) TaxID=1093141 RepID=UPI00029F5987|nr:hypothetical protein NGA_0619400 [Nannochloropsis gaditana CCMP526]EKU20831.1 hypothetical protein NGA_0619400 [Nannochloropsis gaditana CCMP526]|eukprot:XP_005855537.1 hypothetical protein NGA_0619400 [Nannochloropsis gaditana CCMP526]